MIAVIAGFPSISDEKLLFTLMALLSLVLLRIFASKIVVRNVTDDKRRYHTRRTITYVYAFVVVIVIGSIWFQGVASLSTFLGLASAGLAVAMHDTIANVAGFFFIEARKPFRVGDRIQLEGFKGDVIDIRLFQFQNVFPYFNCGGQVDTDCVYDGKGQWGCADDPLSS
jgi:small-conductance mechanosensitive channel